MEKVNKPTCIFLFIAGIAMIALGITVPKFIFPPEDISQHQVNILVRPFLFLFGAAALLLSSFPFVVFFMNKAKEKIKRISDSFTFETSENY